MEESDAPTAVHVEDGENDEVRHASTVTVSVGGKLPNLVTTKQDGDLDINTSSSSNAVTLTIGGANPKADITEEFKFDPNYDSEDHQTDQPTTFETHEHESSHSVTLTIGGKKEDSAESSAPDNSDYTSAFQQSSDGQLHTTTLIIGGTDQLSEVEEAGEPFSLSAGTLEVSPNYEVDSKAYFGIEDISVPASAAAMGAVSGDDSLNMSNTVTLSTGGANQKSEITEDFSFNPNGGTKGYRHEEVVVPLPEGLASSEPISPKAGTHAPYFGIEDNFVAASASMDGVSGTEGLNETETSQKIHDNQGNTQILDSPSSTDAVTVSFSGADQKSELTEESVFNPSGNSDDYPNEDAVDYLADEVVTSKPTSPQAGTHEPYFGADANFVPASAAMEGVSGKEGLIESENSGEIHDSLGSTMAADANIPDITETPSTPHSVLEGDMQIDTHTPYFGLDNFVPPSAAMEGISSEVLLDNSEQSLYEEKAPHDAQDTHSSTFVLSFDSGDGGDNPPSPDKGVVVHTFDENQTNDISMEPQTDPSMSVVHDFDRASASMEAMAFEMKRDVAELNQADFEPDLEPHTTTLNMSVGGTKDIDESGAPQYLQVTSMQADLDTSEESTSLRIPDYSREISNSSLVTRGYSPEDLLDDSYEGRLDDTIHHSPPDIDDEPNSTLMSIKPTDDFSPVIEYRSGFNSEESDNEIDDNAFSEPNNFSPTLQLIVNTDGQQHQETGNLREEMKGMEPSNLKLQDAHVDQIPETETMSQTFTTEVHADPFSTDNQHASLPDEVNEVEKSTAVELQFDPFQMGSSDPEPADPFQPFETSNQISEDLYHSEFQLETNPQSDTHKPYFGFDDNFVPASASTEGICMTSPDSAETGKTAVSLMDDFVADTMTNTWQEPGNQQDKTDSGTGSDGWVPGMIDEANSAELPPNDDIQLGFNEPPPEREAPVSTFSDAIAGNERNEQDFEKGRNVVEDKDESIQTSTAETEGTVLALGSSTELEELETHVIEAATGSTAELHVGAPFMVESPIENKTTAKEPQEYAAEVYADIGEEEATFQSMNDLETEAADLLPTLAGVPDDYQHAPNAAQEEYISDADTASATSRDSKPEVDIPDIDQGDTTDPESEAQVGTVVTTGEYTVNAHIISEDKESHQPVDLNVEDNPHDGDEDEFQQLVSTGDEFEASGILAVEDTIQDRQVSQVEGIVEGADVEIYQIDLQADVDAEDLPDEPVGSALNPESVVLSNLPAQIQTSVPASPIEPGPREEECVENKSLAQSDTGMDDVSDEINPIKMELIDNQEASPMNESMTAHISEEMHNPVEEIMTETSLKEQQSEPAAVESPGYIDFTSPNDILEPIIKIEEVGDEQIDPLARSDLDMGNTIVKIEPIKMELSSNQEASPMDESKADHIDVEMHEPVEELMTETSLEEQHCEPAAVESSGDIEFTSESDTVIPTIKMEGDGDDQEKMQSLLLDHDQEVMENNAEIDQAFEFLDDNTTKVTEGIFAPQISIEDTQPDAKDGEEDMQADDKPQDDAKLDLNLSLADELQLALEVENERPEDDGFMQDGTKSPITIENEDTSIHAGLSVQMMPIRDDEEASPSYRGLESWNSQEELMIGGGEMSTNQGGLSLHTTGFQKTDDMTDDDDNDDHPDDHDRIIQSPGSTTVSSEFEFVATDDASRQDDPLNNTEVIGDQEVYLHVEGTTGVDGMEEDASGEYNPEHPSSDENDDMLIKVDFESFRNSDQSNIDANPIIGPDTTSVEWNQFSTDNMATQQEEPVVEIIQEANQMTLESAPKSLHADLDFGLEEDQRVIGSFEPSTNGNRDGEYEIEHHVDSEISDIIAECDELTHTGADGEVTSQKTLVDDDEVMTEQQLTVKSVPDVHSSSHVSAEPYSMTDQDTEVQVAFEDIVPGYQQQQNSEPLTDNADENASEKSDETPLDDHQNQNPDDKVSTESTQLVEDFVVVPQQQPSYEALPDFNEPSHDPKELAAEISEEGSRTHSIELGFTNILAENTGSKTSSVNDLTELAVAEEFIPEQQSQVESNPEIYPSYDVSSKPTIEIDPQLEIPVVVEEMVPAHQRYQEMEPIAVGSHEAAVSEEQNQPILHGEQAQMEEGYEVVRQHHASYDIQPDEDEAIHIPERESAEIFEQGDKLLNDPNDIETEDTTPILSRDKENDISSQTIISEEIIPEQHNMAESAPSEYPPSDVVTVATLDDPEIDIPVVVEEVIPVDQLHQESEPIPDIHGLGGDGADESFDTNGSKPLEYQDGMEQNEVVEDSVVVPQHQASYETLPDSSKPTQSLQEHMDETVEEDRELKLQPGRNKSDDEIASPTPEAEELQEDVDSKDEAVGESYVMVQEGNYTMDANDDNNQDLDENVPADSTSPNANSSAELNKFDTSDSTDRLADGLDAVHTPTMDTGDLELDSTLMDAMKDTPEVEPIPPITAREEREERDNTKEVTIDGESVILDMNVIDEFKSIYTHGGYVDPEYKQAIIVLSACEFPDRSNPKYQQIMDHLFLYVYHSIQQLVVEEFVIVYYQGGAAKNQLPGLKWMKRCHDKLSHSARKSIKKLHIVHPTFWTRTVLFWSRPFISSKFVKKINLAHTLEELNRILPMKDVTIPDKVRMFDVSLMMK